LSNSADLALVLFIWI